MMFFIIMWWWALSVAALYIAREMWSKASLLFIAISIFCAAVAIFCSQDIN